MKYPKLPTVISAPAGDVEVKIHPAPLRHGDQDVWGLWDESCRTIAVSDELNPRLRWKVFYHELTHVAITDSGLDELLGPEMHEAICEAVAVARIRERFG